MTEHHDEQKKNKESYQISKVTLWQGVSAVLAIAIVFLWLTGGDGGVSGQTNLLIPPTVQPNPSPQPSGQPGRLDVSADDDAVIGDPNAPITMIEFSDFQCPFCKRFYDQTLPQLEEEYIKTGKVKLVYRDFPLNFHPEAAPAAEAAECAREQGKFREFHDGIFNNQAGMGGDLYAKLASDLNLDISKFSDCLSSGKYKNEVQADFQAGQQAGVTGTPTFFINGIKLVGAQPFQNFKQIIDAELASQ